MIRPVPVEYLEVGDLFRTRATWQWGRVVSERDHSGDVRVRLAATLAALPKAAPRLVRAGLNVLPVGN